MSFDDLVEEVATRRRTLVLYSNAEADRELVAPFATHNVDVEFRRIPEGSTPVVVRDADAVVGSVRLETLERLVQPTVTPPWGTDEDTVPRAVRELLDTTLFTTFDRRQPLATVREFEERAWRVGRGHLHAGFQSTRAMTQQTSVYRRLADETDLEPTATRRPPERRRTSPGRPSTSNPRGRSVATGSSYSSPRTRPRASTARSSPRNSRRAGSTGSGPTNGPTSRNCCRTCSRRTADCEHGFAPWG